MAHNAQVSADGTLRSEAGEDLGFAAIVRQGAALTDAETAHALNAVFDDTEVEAALDALGTSINLIISTLEAAGVITT